MRMNRFGRLLRRLPLLLPLLAAACASADASGGGPSQERTLDILAITVGCAVLIVIGGLMYYDNQNN
jgi:hypothetical protein